LNKLHGSVTWWSDNTRQKIFKLAADIMGTEKYTNLMIYPAQKDDVFNFPYYMLQWMFNLTLNEIDELIAIGHKFEDPNITMSVKGALENPNFKLTLVSPSASKIKEKIFQNNKKVNAIDKKFEEWLPDGIKYLKKTAEEHNNKTKVNDEKIEKEKNKMIESAKKIKELQSEVEELKNKDDWSIIRGRPNDVMTWTANDPGTTFNVGLDASNPNFTISPVGDTFDLANANAEPFKIAKTCTNCWKTYLSEDVVDGKCPHCGFDLSSSPDSKKD